MTNEQLAEKVTRTLREMQNEVRRKQGRQPYEYEAKSEA